MLIYIYRPLRLARWMVDNITDSDLKTADKVELLRILGRLLESAQKLCFSRADELAKKLSADAEN